MKMVRSSSIQSSSLSLNLFFLIVLLAFTTTINKASGAKISKPNFLVIHLDDVGYGDISFYSQNLSRGKFKGRVSFSPHIDRMAQEGTAFTTFYASACVCSPSRAGLLTGRYPIRTTVFPGVLGPSDDHGLPLEEITIAEWLRDKANYRTFAVGKWHLGHMEPYLPTFHGFEKWSGMPYSHDFCPCPSKLTNTHDNQCRPWEPPCPLMNKTTIIQQPAILNDLVDYYVQTLITYIDEAVHDKQPFFAYYACQHTHHPQFVKLENLGKSKALGGRNDAYGDAVWEMDDAIGRILDHLRQNDLQENTYVFLASDNGGAPIYHELSGMNSPMRCGKGTTWEGGQRVPFIVWGGNTFKAKVVDDMVAGMDIFPTISHLAGVSTKNFPRVLDGIDFTELMTGEKPLVPVPQKRDTFFYYGLSGSLDAVRVGKFKVHYKTSLWQGETPDCHPPGVHIGSQAMPLLYNVENDAGEWSPLAQTTSLYSTQVGLAQQKLKEHGCTLAHLRTGCDVSSSAHCYGRYRSTEPWPPQPFAPYSPGTRSCCSWGHDIVVPDWKNHHVFSCRKIPGARRGCLRTYNTLCNPGKVLFPDCNGRTVCTRSTGGTEGQTETQCAAEATPSECPEGWNILYCPLGTFQCKGLTPSGGGICAANRRECDQMYGGIAYTSRTCTECEGSSLLQPAATFAEKNVVERGHKTKQGGTDEGTDASEDEDQAEEGTGDEEDADVDWDKDDDRRFRHTPFRRRPKWSKRRIPTSNQMFPLVTGTLLLLVAVVGTGICACRKCCGDTKGRYKYLPQDEAPNDG